MKKILPDNLKKRKYYKWRRIIRSIHKANESTITKRFTWLKPEIAKHDNGMYNYSDHIFKIIMVDKSKVKFTNDIRTFLWMRKLVCQKNFRDR